MRIPSDQDKDRFVQLWIRLHFGVGVEAAWQRIADAYTERHRRYHDWNHIRWCLSQFNLLVQGHTLSDPDAVEFAIYFHDIVYQPGAPDNEERSVDVAMQFLQSGTFQFRNIVKILILDTKHQFTPVTPDGLYLADIDVSSMGDGEQNARAIPALRKEFLQFCSAEEYEIGRRAFIKSFLARKEIYYTEYFHSRYEAAARRNLAKQLET